MASGSNNLTSYKAKQIIGSSVAASPAGALLLTGEHYTGNTWLYHYGYGGTTNPWGIFHDTTTGKLIIKGNGTDSFWIKMNTGDTYIYGKVGINYDPTTTNNTQQLYVNGDTTITGVTTHNDYIYRAYSASSGTPMIWMNGSDYDNYLWQIGNGTANGEQYYGYGLKYIGTGSDVAKYLQLIADNQNGTDVIAISVNQSGQIGLGTNADTSYRLYVDGTTWLNDNLYLAAGKHIYMNYNSTDYNVINNHSNGNISVNAAGGDGLFLGWYQTPGIFMYYTTADNSTRTKFFEVNSDGAYALTRFGVNGQNTSYTLYVNGTITATDTIYSNGGYLQSTANGNTVTIGSQNTGWCHFTNSADIPFYFSEAIHAVDGFTIYNTGDNHWRNGYLKINKTDGGDCYLELRRNTNADWRIINSGGNLYFQNNWTSAKGSYFNVLTLDFNTGRAHFKEYVYASYYNASCGAEAPTDSSYWIFANSDGFFRKSSRANAVTKLDLEHKWVRLAGDTMTGNLFISGTGDKYFEVKCTDTGCRVELDNSNGKHGIWSSGYWNGSAYTASALWMLYRHTDGGVCCGTDFSAGGLLYTSKNGNTVAIGSQNSGFCHIYNSTSIPFIFNNTVCTASGDLGTTSYPFNNLILKSGGRVSGNGGALYLGNSSNANWVLIADCCAQAGSAYWKIYSGSGEATFKKVYNAVWNDYAECREVETEEPGYCVTETKSGKMIKTTKRLQAGCKIISDTFGTCMGETETAKTPIAVAGRVLVYPYRAREEYTLGAAVCSAPDGMVDIMSRDEIMMYPERIVGTVSEIPTYDIWNGGISKDPDPISVNGRIWIYVK